MRRERCACGATLVFPDDPEEWPEHMSMHVRSVRHRDWWAATFPERVPLRSLEEIDAYEKRLVAA